MRAYIYKKLLNMASGVLGTPPYLIFFVSDKCVNKCSHCWYNDDWKNNNISNEILSFNEIEKISKAIRHISFLTLTGGEAFLRNDISEIAELFILNTKLKRLDIPTSGFNPDLIETKAIEILKLSRGTAFRIDVSLDGLESTHNQIRNNQKAFGNAVETIRRLRKLRKKYTNFDVSIITTISKINQNEIEDISKLVEAILPDGEWMVNIQRPAFWSDPKPDIDLDAYIKANEIIDNRLKLNHFSGDKGYNYGKMITAKNAARRDVIINTLKNKQKGGGCTAGALAGVIFNDGEVRPCESSDLSFGNIREYDYNLHKIWNSEDAIRVRAEIQDSRCLCTHECFLSTSILVHPSSLLRLILKRIHLS